MSGKSKKVKGTKQTLEYVETEFKLHTKRLKCKNERQKELIEQIDSKPIIFSAGFAGTGKTTIALYAALRAIERGEYQKLVLVKSVQPIRNQDLGFMPGPEMSKISPFMESFRIILDDLLGEEQRQLAEKEGIIIYKSPTFFRGITIKDAIVIVDEAQQFDDYLLTTIVSRLGETSKMIFLGDDLQTDVQRRESAFKKWLQIFQDDEKIGSVRFLPEDCVRNPIITYVLNKVTMYNESCLQNIKEKNQKTTDGTTPGTNQINTQY